MSAILHAIRRTFGWSNSRQSWLERGAGLAWLALVALAFRYGARLGTGQRLLLGALLLLSLVMLLRRGWIKLLGPVFFYDAVRSARRGRYFLIRGIYTGFILGLLGWTYFLWTMRSVDGAIPTGDLAIFAESFFFAFLAVQMVAVILLTPAFVAGAIAEEKERQTLDYLLATDLRNREIVLGKLVSRLGNLTLLVLAGLPILSLMEMLGGVEPRLVLGAFAVTGVMLLTLAALSLVCSVHARRARDAILLTYLLIIAYQGATLGFLGVVHFGEMDRAVVVPAGVLPWVTTVQDDPDAPPVDEPFTLGDLAERVNDGNLPMFCYRLGLEVTRGSTVADELPRLLRDFAAVNLTLAALWIVWAILAVRRVALRQQHRAAVPLRGMALVRRPPVGLFPLLWKEAIAEAGFRASLARRAITYLTVIAVAVPTGAILFDYFAFGEVGARQLTAGWVLTVVVMVPMLSLLAVAVRASAAVSGERDRQTLDALLTLPVSSDAILFSKWLGCLLGLRWTVLAVLATLTICGWIGGPSLWVVPLLLIAWPIYAGLIAMIGIAYSVVCKTTLRATLATLLTTVAVAAGHWALWLVYLPFLLTAEDSQETMRTLQRVHEALTPPVVLANIGHVRNGLGDLIVDDTDGRTFVFMVLALALWVLGTVAAWFVASRPFRALANGGVQTPPGLPPLDEAAAVSRAVARETRRRRLRRVAVAGTLLLPVAGLVSAYIYVGHEADRRLNAVIAELDADEPGWRLADLEAARKELPIEKNSAEKVRATRKLLPRTWPPAPAPAPMPAAPPGILERLMKLPPEEMLSDDDLHDAVQLLNEVEAARAEALQLADMPEGRYPLIWAPILIFTTLNDQQESRTVANLLRAEAALAAHAGDPDGALIVARAMLNVARALGDEPILISQLIRMSQRKMALDAIERTLAQGQPGDAELARLQAALEQEAREPILLRAYRSERAFFHETIRQIRSGELKASAFLAGGATQDLAMAASAKAAHPAGLKQLSRLVALTRLPVHEQAAESAAIDRDAAKGPWLYHMLLPKPASISASYRRNQAWMYSAIAALAAERFRRQQGRWPNTLDELVPVFLSAVPLDPSDGKPLRLRRVDNGIVLYSVGGDGVDDDGNLDRKNMDTAGTDLGFRLWDVTARRQKPAAPEVNPGPRSGP